MPHYLESLSFTKKKNNTRTKNKTPIFDNGDIIIIITSEALFVFFFENAFFGLGTKIKQRFLFVVDRHFFCQ